MSSAKVIMMDGEKGKQEVVVMPATEYIDNKVNEKYGNLEVRIDSGFREVRADVRHLERYQTLMTAVYGVIVGVILVVSAWFMYQSGKTAEMHVERVREEARLYREKNDNELKFIKEKTDYASGNIGNQIKSISDKLDKYIKKSGEKECK